MGKKTLHAALLKLKKDIKEKKILLPMCGLCVNIECLSSEDKQKFAALIRTWPQHSGDYNYPVPSPIKHGTARTYYMLCKKMYDKKTRYGKSRFDLLNFLIKRTS